MSTNSTALAEALIETVTRAFYPDSYIVVVDTLLRERFCVEEELGPRLKMPGKDVRKIVNQLELEGLLRFEQVHLDDNKNTLKCYYIDYQAFVDVVRLRIYTMQKHLTSEETRELTDVYYECPTCLNKYNSLEAQRLLSLDYKFVCSNCCPYENFRQCRSEEYYRLREIDNRGQISALQSLQRRVDEQLHTAPGLHLGIMNLLASLRDVHDLPRNLPSENMRRGVSKASVDDEHAMEEIVHNLAHSTANKYGGSHLNAKTIRAIEKALRSTDASGINVQDSVSGGGKDGPGGKSMYNINITHDGSHADGMTPLSAANDNTIGCGIGTTGGMSAGQSARRDAIVQEVSARERLLEKRESALPHFLKDSHVHGASDVLRKAQTLQAERSGLLPTKEQDDLQRVNAAAAAAAAEAAAQMESGLADLMDIMSAASVPTTSSIKSPPPTSEDPASKRPKVEDPVSEPATAAAAVPADESQVDASDMGDIAWEEDVAWEEE